MNDTTTILFGTLLPFFLTSAGSAMVFFFRDPLDKHPHEPDVQMLMRVCDVHNVPLATNPASAELMLRGYETQGH